MQNPKTAIDAILKASGQPADGGFKLYPLTIARYAALDLIDSPFIVPSKKMTFDEVIPSIYVMAVPARQLAKYSSKNIDELKADAFEWSESLSPEHLAAALDTIAGGIEAVSKLAPETVENDKKKASELQATDG